MTEPERLEAIGHVAAALRSAAACVEEGETDLVAAVLPDLLRVIECVARGADLDENVEVKHQVLMAHLL
jgi:hypothetical protein